ncbi:UNVERIFIED_CONTAM: hypothetical protein HDU68_005586 [Siphonaria sp. JEL0065]|nr:hypothetical protein HDU68_005586 [Siphonaria sp. JEL0065]
MATTKEKATFATLVRVSAIGCLLSSVYLGLIAVAELSPLGHEEALVLVTRTTVSLPLWLDVLSVALSLWPLGPQAWAWNGLVASAAAAAGFLFSVGGEPIAASRAAVLVAVLMAAAGSSKASQKLNSPIVAHLAALLVLLLSATAVVQYIGTTRLPPSNRVEIKAADSVYHMHLNCTGFPKNKQSPTIVLETGLAVPEIASWSSLDLPTLRVCRYDRAGYGRSDSGPFPLTAKRAADVLYQLLKNANEQGPFVLVGHSYGGHIIRLFAHAHPEQVSGLVLLDPSDEEYFVNLQALDASQSMDSFLSQFKMLALSTGFTGAVLAPFAAADRLMISVLNKEHQRIYSANEIDVVFHGKYWKAVTSEILNFPTISASQVRSTFPRTPRTNLPIAILTSTTKVLPFCTPNKTFIMEKDFSYLAPVDHSRVCVPNAVTATSSSDDITKTSIAQAQAHFLGHWRLATRLSEKTRFMFGPGGHYLMFENGGNQIIASAILEVVEEADKYIRGEYLSKQQEVKASTKILDNNDYDDMDDDVYIENEL